MKNLELMGVQEMDAFEMENVDGGWNWLGSLFFGVFDGVFGLVLFGPIGGVVGAVVGVVQGGV